jgi:hypothetical protein
MWNAPRDLRIFAAPAMVQRVQATLSVVPARRLSVVVPPFPNAIGAVEAASRGGRPCLVFGDSLNVAAVAILFAAGADGFETDFSNLPHAAHVVAAGGVSLEAVSAAAILQLARTVSDPRLDQLSAVARRCAQGMRWPDVIVVADTRHLSEHLKLLRALL